MSCKLHANLGHLANTAPAALIYSVYLTEMMAWLIVGRIYTVPHLEQIEAERHLTIRA